MSDDTLDTTGAVQDYLKAPDFLGGPDPATQARVSVASAVGSSPDLEAELRRVAQRTGVPMSSARAMPEEVKRRATLADLDFDEMAQRLPGTVAFLSKQDNALVAHDDIENMGLLESTVNSFKRGWQGLKQLGPTLTLANQGGALANIDDIDKQLAAGKTPEQIASSQLGPLANMYAYMTVEERAAFRKNVVPTMPSTVSKAAARFAELQSNKAAIPSKPVAQEFAGAKTWGDAFGALGRHPLDILATIGPESMVQSLPGMAAAIPATIAAGPVGGAAAMGANSFAVDYAATVQDVLQGEGVDLKDPVAVQKAMQNPAILAKALEQASRHAGVVAPMDALSGGLASKTLLPKAAATALTARPVAKAAAGMGVQTVVQGALGAAGEAGGQVAAGQELQPGQILAEAVGEFAGAPVEVMSMSAERVREAAKQRADLRQKVVESTQDAQSLQALVQTAAKSKLMTRDPQALADFVQKVADDGKAPSEVFVDAKTFAEALNQNGITVEQAFAAMPSVQRQFAEAAASGGDIAIPIGEFTAGVAGSPIEQALMQHVRTDPEALSQAEATQVMKGQAEALKADAERIIAEQGVESETAKSAATVRGAVYDQLQTAGRFKPDVNAAYADMVRDFYTVQAQRLGLTPEELFKKHPLTIKAEGLFARESALEQQKDRLQPSPVLNTPRTPTREEMLAHGRVETVPLTKAFSTQAQRQWDRFNAGDHPPPMVEGFDDKPVAVRLRSGEYLVLDGHHRADRALQAGGAEMPMHVIDAAAYDPQNAGRTPQPGYRRNDIDDDDLARQLLEQRADDPGAAALELGKIDGLFQYPKSAATDLAQIAQEKRPDLRIERETITQPDGSEKPTGNWNIRTPKGDDAIVTERDGKVWINVAGLAPGSEGSLIYDLVANYALNNGLKFIGDPAGLSNAAMVRRTENMLSSAIKYGTTDHLEPHPKQLQGNDTIPALKWKDGDTAANVRSMMEAVVAANAKLSPAGSGVDYDAATGQFKDSEGVTLDADGLGELSDLGRGTAGAGAPGSATLQRAALFRALLSGPDRQRGVLESLRRLADDGGPGAGSFYQDQKVKGPKGTFTPATSTITLLAKADLSTFLHETGHFYLETLAAMASAPDAPAEIVQDMQTVLEWFGFKGTATEWLAGDVNTRRDAHEKFARGFEAYLFEGKAPSASLAPLFQRFAAWMKHIYKSIVTLGVEINPEIRSVFDRMLASEQQIKEAEAARGYAPLFKDAVDAGMTEAEWASYQALGAEATTDAVVDLQRRSLRDMQWLTNARSRVLKALQKDAKAKRKALAEEVRAEVATMPIYRAENFLRTGRLETENPSNAQRKALEAVAGMDTKLDLSALKEMYGEGPAAPWRYLSTGKRGLAASEGIHPDVAAEILGYDSGDALVRTLLSAEPQAEVVEGMTDQRMLERYGDLADEQAIERATNEALANEARGKFLATELSTLNKALGKPRVLVAAAKQLAAQIINRKLVKDIRPARFAAAETRAAKEAAETKDVITRATAKRNQLLNHYAGRAATDALAEIERGVEYLKKFDKESVRTSIDVEYTDQIEELLERYDLRKSTSLTDIAKRQSLAKWVESQREIGVEPDIPANLLEGLERVSYKELPLEDFRGLVDTVKQIEHLGRLKHRLLTAKDQREFAVIKDEIVESIHANSRGRTADTRTPNTVLGETMLGLKRFWASHIKAATWARVMDGGKDGGAMWEHVIRAANEAGDKETGMREKATKDLAALVAPVLAAGKMGGKGTFFPTVNRSLNREAVIAIALNVGNDGNKQRLLGGEGWTEAQLQPVLDSLSAGEWQFVQKVWDYFESFRPEIAAKERRVYGREPNWVEPTPVRTPHGELRGGYYPIKYDSRASERAEAHADAEEAKRQMQAAYTSATTRRSFTKARAEEVKGRPLMYSLDGIYNGVQEIIHDLSWHEFLIDANRLVKNRSIAAAIRNTYGPEVHQQFKSWLEDVAVGEQGAQRAAEHALGWLRQGVSVSGLGFNVMSALMQPLGLTQSMVRIGPQWVGRGLVKAMGSPMATSAEITAKSTFMRTRFMTRLREINEVRNQVKGQGKIRRGIDGAAYALMLRAQQLVDIPTWWGAYEKAIAEGNGEERAARLADQAVIDSQGGGQTKDLSAIERGGPAIKLFTTFYSFFNTALNVGVQSTMTEESRAKLAANYLLLYVVPAVFGAMLKDALTPGDSGDWEDPQKAARKLAGEQLSYLMGLMFGAREIAGTTAAVVKGQPVGADYTGPAGLRMLGDFSKLVKEGAQGEADTGLRKAIINFAGELLRLPSAQINRSTTGIQALKEGKTENPLAVVFGYQERH